MQTTAITPYNWEEIQQKLGLQQASSKVVQPVASHPLAQAVLSIPELLRRQCRDGERTNHLTRLAGALVAKGFDVVECIDLCLQWNERNIEPLDNEKIESTCRSIFNLDQRNHPDRHEVGLASVPLFDLSAGRIDQYLATKPPARRWLLNELIVLGKVGAIIAPGGSSKSQWLLQLAVGVATGIPVADHWQIGEPGGVMVFFAEDDEDEIHRRLHRIKNHLQLRGHGQDLRNIEDRLFVFSTIGTDTLLTKRDRSGEVSSTAIVDRISTLAAQVEDLKLIVIDPASRFRGGEENSNEDATRFVEALETLAKVTGATVLIAHHTNKGSYSGDGEPGQGASRGASALTDGLRWLMNLGRLSDKQISFIGGGKDQIGKYVAATVTKTNYSAFPAPVFLERLDDGYLSAISPAQAQQRGETQAIMRVLAVLSQEPKPQSARYLEDHYGGVSGPLKMPKQGVRTIVKMAIERGLVQGAERKPLSVTPLGVEMMKSVHATTEDARHAPEKGPRKKV